MSRMSLEHTPGDLTPERGPDDTDEDAAHVVEVYGM